MTTTTNILCYICALLYAVTIVQGVFFTKMEEDENGLQHPRIGKRLRDLQNMFPSTHLLENSGVVFPRDVRQNIMPTYRLMDLISQQPYTSVNDDTENDYRTAVQDRSSSDLARQRLMELFESSMNPK